MKITVEMMMTKDPEICYSREQVEKLWGDNESLTLMQISNLDIQVPDRIWAITRFLNDKSNRLFVADCVERCVVKIEEADLKQRAEKLIEKVRMHARGEIMNDQLAAYWAAYSAADSAAYWTAYWAAYSAADRAAYLSKERRWQLARIREYIDADE